MTEPAGYLPLHKSAQRLTLGFSLVTLHDVKTVRGNTIRRLRRRYGWSQVELAARLGTDAVTVSRWERGVATPRSSARARLRELFEAPRRGAIDELVRTLGVKSAERTLRRSFLLAQRPPRPWFAADPTARLREVDRTLAEQLDFKTRVRF